MKTLSKARGACLLGFLLFFNACKTPPAPPEAARVEALGQELWRAGASFYAEKDYTQFKKDLKNGKEKLTQENAKYGWFRSYDSLRIEFRDIVRRGEDILAKIDELKTSKARACAAQASALMARVDRLKQMTDYFNENGPVRKNLSQAEIMLSKAETLIRKESYESVEEDLDAAARFIKRAEQSMTSLLGRYMEKGQLEKWRKWAEETVAESKSNGTIAILVNKLERKLTIYKKGAVLSSYVIGLGRFGLSDKLYSGDEATPEGKYHVINKIQNSPFSKALLINYPNEEDIKVFALAKKEGLIPVRAGIGGYIEIHGGGKDSLTRGCVGLEDKDMDVVYKSAEIGTPVTIVGAVSIENTILAEIKKFEKND